MTTALAMDRRTAQPARLATAIMFVTQAFLFASWTAHIPLVKASLGLDEAQLGLALFGAPIGSVLATIATGWLLPRLGSRRMVQICLVGYCATAWPIGLAGSGAQLFVALAVWGVFQGALDVSMNAQAVFVEHRMRRPLMSGFHALWSLGSFAGVALGAVAVAAGVALSAQLLVVGAAGLLVAGTATRFMVADPPHVEAVHGRAGTARVWRHPVVLMLGAVALACMLCEGAAADWSAVYLHESLGAPPAVAALGYGAYSAAMVVMRLMGDRMLARAQPRRLLPLLAAVAAGGMTVALLVGNTALAIAGFATLGLGLALVVPAAFTAAGRLPGVHPGAAVAAVSAIGWVGFVAGPPVIGHLAGMVTLPVALGLLPILTAAIALTIRASRSFAPGVPSAA